MAARAARGGLRKVRLSDAWLMQRPGLAEPPSPPSAFWKRFELAGPLMQAIENAQCVQGVFGSDAIADAFEVVHRGNLKP